MLSRSLIYAPDALADMEDATAWLTQPGAGMAARRRLADIWTHIERLREMPCLYPALNRPGIRECPCRGGYRALYVVEPDTGDNATAGNVVVLRVFGPGQNRGDAFVPWRDRA